jgi:hypothetical protein
MSEPTGYEDVHGRMVNVGDTVVCWDGRKDGSDMSQRLEGKVTKPDSKGWTRYEVAGNELALTCAEHVEVITFKSKVNI